MNKFLAQYSIGASIRSQLSSNLATFHQDQLSTLLLLEDEETQRRSGGSLPGKAANLPRDPVAGHIQLIQDYFNPTPVYSKAHFRRRFRMSRRMFLRIMVALGEDNEYFTQRRDALGKVGNSPHQKCTAAIRQLAYGTTADQMDEYLCIAESTAVQCLLHFCNGLIQKFGPHYQRKATA